MFMAEVIVLQPSAEGLVDLLDGLQVTVFHDEVPLHEPEKPFHFSLGLRSLAIGQGNIGTHHLILAKPSLLDIFFP